MGCSVMMIDTFGHASEPCSYTAWERMSRSTFFKADASVLSPCCTRAIDEVQRVSRTRLAEECTTLRQEADSSSGARVPRSVQMRT